ncbi:MATE family efflux transporter [Nocardia stercoris]|uniref:MATE family efflux transporter n=1 Tax=Nocardia stercoris TaxID=2483361 RepID=UPI001F3481A1|nr:MATE family efflux transporter [Nocardia stercoris]
MDAGAGRILGIAIPTLGVLIAEPLYLLYDLAVVGRLGALPLAGLAIGVLILGVVSTQLTFMTYGTTARAARKHGAGDDRGAVQEGVQASWIAIGAGLAIVAVVQVGAGWICAVVAGEPDSAEAAARWLRIAVWGVPLILLTMAGNGWLRGVQRTRLPLAFVLAGEVVSAVLCPVLVHGWLGAPQLGLAGSAVANVAGQAVTGALFLSVLLRQQVSFAPHFGVMAAQLLLGRDLVLRSLSFQICFISAGAVASRFGPDSVGAHQLVYQIWNFLAMFLDSLAIAAQTLTGAALGADDAEGAKRLAGRLTLWSTALATVLALGFAAGHAVIPTWFVTDPGVLDRVHAIWWIFVCLIPIGGVVFALDGVLLGAGDAAYLRNITLAGGLLGYLPMIWLSLAFGWGVVGIWSGLATFIVARCIAVLARAYSGRWARTGADV